MPNPKTLTLHPTPVDWSRIPIVYPPRRPIPPPQRHSTNIIFSANCSKKCRSDRSSFHVGICRSGFGDTAVGSFCPIAPGQSDHPVAVLRMDLPAGEYLTMVALCYCAGVLFIITRWSTTPSVHALLACLLLASFVLAGLTVDAQTFLLARLIFLLLSKDDRVSAPPLNHRGRTKQPRTTMEAAFLESGTNVDKVRGDSFVLGFGCFALHDHNSRPLGGGQNLKC